MKTELASSKLVPFLSEKFKTELKYNQDSVIERKEVFINKVQSVNDAEGTCECVISTEEPDRMGDVVVSSGVDTSEFKKIPSVYVNHKYAALPVAVCEELVHKNKSIVAKIKFVTSIPAIKNIFELVKAGALRGVSVGFEAKEMLQKGTREFDTYVKDALMDATTLTKVRRIFKSWKLYEFSVCSVPANSNCYIKSLVELNQEVSPELGKMLGYEELPKPSELKDIVSLVDGNELAKDTDKIIEEILKVDAIEEAEEVIVIKEDNETEEEDEKNYTDEQLKEGTEIEKEEHSDLIPYINTATITPDEFFSMIAKVHLKEDAEYYKASDEVEVESEVEPEDKPVEPKAIEVPVVKEVESHWNVIRTPDEVKNYIKKAVESKLSGKIEIDW